MILKKHIFKPAKKKSPVIFHAQGVGIFDFKIAGQELLVLMQRQGDTNGELVLKIFDLSEKDETSVSMRSMLINHRSEVFTQFTSISNPKEWVADSNRDIGNPRLENFYSRVQVVNLIREICLRNALDFDQKKVEAKLEQINSIINAYKNRCENIGGTGIKIMPLNRTKKHLLVWDPDRCILFYDFSDPKNRKDGGNKEPKCIWVNSERNETRMKQLWVLDYATDFILILERREQAECMYFKYEEILWMYHIKKDHWRRINIRLPGKGVPCKNKLNRTMVIFGGATLDRECESKMTVSIMEVSIVDPMLPEETDTSLI